MRLKFRPLGTTAEGGGGGDRGLVRGGSWTRQWRLWTGEDKRQGAFRRKIKLIDSNAKCRYLKKLTCKGALRHVFICLRPPPFLLVRKRVLQYTPAEYGLQNNSTPLPPPPVQYILYFDFGKGGRGGGGETERRFEGNSSHSWVENTNRTDCIFSL